MGRGVLLVTLFGCSVAQGQLLMESTRPGMPIHLLPSDTAVLEAREPRTDMPCEVKPVPPALGYDLTFHAAFDISLPLRTVAGAGTGLISILRVTPEGGGEPVYFSQKWTVPPLDENSRGEAGLHGTFLLGEGKYQVDWLMRDRAERYCSAFWQVSALRRGRDRQIELQIAPGAVDSAMREPFREEAPVQRDSDRALNVLVLLHVAPQSDGGAEMRDTETQAMVSILRNIVRERRFARFSVTAFNIDRRIVVYRQVAAPKIDFPALGRAVKELHFGTVTVQRLGEREGGAPFLAGLVADELALQKPDIVMIVGPKIAPDEGSLRNSLKQLPDPSCPVFYLNYTSAPEINPWRDLLGSAVKVWNGLEYSISKPSDLFFAWTGVTSRLAAAPQK